MRLAGIPLDPDLVVLAGHRAAIEAAHDAGDWRGVVDAMHRAGAVHDRITAARTARAASRRRVDAHGHLEPPRPVRIDRR